MSVGAFLPSGHSGVAATRGVPIAPYLLPLIAPSRFVSKKIPDATAGGVVKVLDMDVTTSGRTNYVFVHYCNRAGEVFFIGARVTDPILGTSVCGLNAASSWSEIMDTNYDLVFPICSQFRIKAASVAIGSTVLNGTFTAGRIPSTFNPVFFDPLGVTSID